VSVSAAPATTPAATAPAAVKQEKPPASAARRFGLVGVAALAFFLITAVSPPALIGHLVVFALAIVIGYYVIGHVHHALHTPLMSVTNAISGIIVVGALLQVGHDAAGIGGLGITVVAALAILLASINVFGGFAVTRRMLAMFRRS
jgi:NAD(P) transhydrogenase subunit alpha